MNKKIIILIGLIIFTSSIVILNKEKINNIFENTINYLKLSSDRQELYNKMMISEIKIVQRETGTVPFNESPASDTNGNDISASDDYVRTSDKVKYKLEVAISPNNTDNKVEETNGLTGGVIKVKATLPNQGNLINLTWVEDAWMNNIEYNEDKTIITAEYYAPSTIDITNATQELSFTVLVGGHKVAVDQTMLPEFEVWMEGNSPDNTSSSIDSMKIKDSQNPFIISGTPSYNIVLQPEYGTLKKSTKTINGQDVQGRYKNVPIGVALTKLDGMPDLRGVEYPSETFSVNLGIEYRYNIENGTSGTITAETEDAIDILNGTMIQAYSINGELNENHYPNIKDTATVHRLPYGRLDLGTEKNSVVDSGTITASLNNNILNVTFNNFKVGNTFPSTPSNDASTDSFNPDNYYFLAGNVELFIPFYGDQTQRNDYHLYITAESASYQVLDGTNYSIDSGENSINDTDSSDNYYNLSFENYLSGNYSYGLWAYDTKWNILGTKDNNYGDASREIGQYFNIANIHGLIDGDFEGGQTVLLVWEADKIGIRSIGTTWYSVYTYGNGELPSKENITVSYGIYTANPTSGLTSYQELNSSYYSSFTWYDTYDEASANGTVTAVFYDDPDMVGNDANRKYYNYFKILDKEENIGKTASFRVKVYAYEDAERTKKNNFRTSNYIPTKYNELGQITSNENDWGIGKTILITGEQSSISIKSIENNEEKTTYDIQDSIVNYEVTPTMESTNNHIVDEVFVHVTLPKGLSYVENSSNKEPESITINEDGTTIVTWLYQDWTTNSSPPDYEKITFNAEISSDTINNQLYTTKAVIFTDGDLRDEYSYRSSTSTIKVINLSGSQLSKIVDKKVIDIGEDVTITTTIGNSSSSVLNKVRILEILPKDNILNSQIKGNYIIKNISLNTNQKVYYTTKSLNDLNLTIKDNKYSAQDIDLTDGNWTEILDTNNIPNNATILIIQIESINSYTSTEYSYTLDTSNTEIKDIIAYNSYLTSNSTTTILKNSSLSTTIVNRIIEGSIIPFDENTRMPSTITVNLYDENDQLVDTTTTNNNSYKFEKISKGNYYIKFEIPEDYEISLTGSNKADTTGKTSLITEHNNSPTTEEEIVSDINAVIKLKDAILTTNHYIEGTTTELSETTTENVHWGDTYTTEVASDINENYELVSTPSNATGTIKGDIVVTYYYKLKSATLTVHHYIEGTTTELSKTTTENVHWGDAYTTEVAKDINENYELVSTPSNATGTIKGDTVVTYYYKLKSATLTVHHYIEGTTTELSKTTTENVHWGDTYTTEVAKDINENYELVGTPTNASGTIKGDIVVTYYYKLKSATLTVHHYIEGTTTELSKTTTENVHWGDAYTTEVAKDINENYELVSTPSNATGTIKGDIVVTYYYKLKSATLTIHHYVENTKVELSETIIKNVHWGDVYTTSPATDISINYELSKTPANASGTIKGDTIVNYYYNLKETSLIVHHYIEGTTTELSPSEITIVHWGDTYKTSPSTDISENYELVSTPTNATGTIQGSTVVIYYYKLKSATLTIQHYIEGATTEIAATENKLVYWGEEYKTSPSTNISSNYEVSIIPSNSSGTIKGNVVVTYYYKLKTSTIITKYLEYNTNNVIAPQETIQKNFGENYETSESIKIPDNYELYQKTDNYIGIVNDSNIEVIYYYQKKDSQIQTTISLNGPEEIKKKDEEVNYKINYENKITYYSSSVTSTIIMSLPYSIDESKSSLDGGIYNQDQKTITWISNKANLDADLTTQTISEEKNLKIVYEDINPLSRTMATEVTSTIKLDNKERTATAQKVTYIKIAGQIIVHHYLENTTEKINNDTISNGLVGDKYISSSLNKNGYIAVKEPTNKNYTYTEETQEIIYEYKRITLNITTKVVSNGGGTIIGDETLYYGDDSTPNTIKISAEDGYIIDTIKINNINYKVTDKKQMVIEPLKHVTEDTIVEVSFIEISLENPDTSSIIAIFTISGLFILTSTSVVLIKKYKPRMKKI
ncbi:MAG: MucBP domain-containing protein [Candidatus Coprovivens sp.]